MNVIDKTTIESIGRTLKVRYNLLSEQDTFKYVTDIVELIEEDLEKEKDSIIDEYELYQIELENTVVQLQSEIADLEAEIYNLTCDIDELKERLNECEHESI